MSAKLLSVVANRLDDRAVTVFDRDVSRMFALIADQVAGGVCEDDGLGAWREITDLAEDMAIEYLLNEEDV